MPRTCFISDLSFRTKMLATVTTVVVLMLGVSLSVISERFKLQIHDNAAELLRTAEGVLKIRQRSSSEELQVGPTLPEDRAIIVGFCSPSSSGAETGGGE